MQTPTLTPDYIVDPYGRAIPRVVIGLPGPRAITLPRPLDPSRVIFDAEFADIPDPAVIDVMGGK